MVVVAGNIIAAPIPSRTAHPKSSMGALILKVAMVVPEAYMRSPVKNVFFLPKISCSLLPSNMKEAIMRAYKAIIA